MPNERNTEMQESLRREVNLLQKRCVEACNIIENTPTHTELITPDNVGEKTLCYIEGVRTDIDNSNTPIVTDDNLLTSQFLNEIKHRTLEVEELIAYTRGSIHDVENEINRLNSLIKTSQEAKSRPRVQMQAVQPPHVEKAKERFLTMKNELHGLINSLFPNHAELITDVLGQLMQQKLNEASSDYIPITSESYQVVELLKDINLVTANPYNNTEVKLAY
ncbi:uncharacterized protein LOC135080770 [Ostrinia nubilalis]|uniref:uncharacterized protein LOC135080770 n=1 Tax=Ostrinia nubilalis TaxID=29057 RepID=UPI00308251C9